MKRTLLIALLALAGLVGRPSTASADITFFIGMQPTPDARALRGVAAGVSMLIVGFEFDYGNMPQNEEKGLPGLQTGMFNIMVQTPTNTSIYVTAGGGIFRETLGASHVTNFATNVGGGIKIGLFGPIHVRVDYRLFTMRGNVRTARPQRLYVGINWPF